MDRKPSSCRYRPQAQSERDDSFLNKIQKVEQQLKMKEVKWDIERQQMKNEINALQQRMIHMEQNKMVPQEAVVDIDRLQRSIHNLCYGQQPFPKSESVDYNMNKMRNANSKYSLHSDPEFGFFYKFQN